MTVETEQTTTTEAATGVSLSDGAAEKVASLLAQEGRDDLALRIAVQPGGCSGLRYQLFFDERSLDGDQTFGFGGVNVVVDRMSLARRSTSSTRSRSRASRSTTRRPPVRAPAATRSTEPPLSPPRSAPTTPSCRAGGRCLWCGGAPRHHRIHRHGPPHDLPGQVRRLAGPRPARQDLAVLPRRRPRRPPGKVMR
jgi:iron-sulfur cluster assembly accessory protein